MIRIARSVRIIVCVMAIFAAATLITGCSSEPESSATTSDDGAVSQQSGASSERSPKNSSENSTAQAVPQSEQEPEFGGRLVLGTIGDIVNLIPSLSSDAGSHDVAEKIYVGALKYDKNLNITTDAAESYEVLDGGRRLRITMRKDIKWQDGEPLTAKDVEFTYKLMIDPDTPTPYADDFMRVKKFTLIDNYTFEVEYEAPYARSLITWMSAILPKHVLEGEELLNHPQSRNPIGAGPYRLKEWVAGERIVLEASDTYFAGRPYIDEIVYRIIPDLSTMFLELKAGRVDLMSLSAAQYLFQTKGPEWEQQYNKYKYLAFGYLYMGYNLQKPMFQDKRVRQALAMAIDRESMIKGVLYGLGESTVGPYKPGTWVYNDDISPYPYSIDKAKALLAEAGWSDSDGDGVLDKNGEPFAFTLMTNHGNERRQKVATIIQSQLKDVGISVTIRTVEWTAFLNEFVDKGRFDAIISSWNILQDPDIFPVWHSSQARDGGLNHVRFVNAEMDELLLKGQSTLDTAERKKYYDRIQEILHEEQPYCFLFVPYSLPIVHSRFQNIEPAPAGITHNMDRWWIPSAQRKYEVAR